jgi:hypothetical protein
LKLKDITVGSEEHAMNWIFSTELPFLTSSVMKNRTL